jgi:hypothetical protein
MALAVVVDMVVKGGVFVTITAVLKVELHMEMQISLVSLAVEVAILALVIHLLVVVL